MRIEQIPVFSELYSVVRPQLEIVRRRLEPELQSLEPAVAAAALEDDLREYWASRFGLDQRASDSILNFTLDDDALMRRDALLDLTAFCVALDANDMVADFSSVLPRT